MHDRSEIFRVAGAPWGGGSDHRVREVEKSRVSDCVPIEGLLEKFGPEVSTNVILAQVTEKKVDFEGNPSDPKARAHEKKIEPWGGDVTPRLSGRVR